LDESVPRQLAVPLDLAGFSTTPYPNEWKQTKNSELLMLAEQNAFDVLITSEKNIYAQQNLRGRKLALVVLPTNRRGTLWSARPTSWTQSKGSSPGSTSSLR
jgi:hypothetical protein